MIIGIPKETKSNENRVSMTPAGVEILKQNGHDVLVEKNAGTASGFEDLSYQWSGARIVGSREEVFSRSEMIVRVKAPQFEEFDLLRENRIYFSFLHLAASRSTAESLMQKRSVNIAYETIQRNDGTLPILIPMSEIAGPMAIQEGAKYLERAQGGQGLLLGGVPGVDPGLVVIIGGGTVGLSAAKTASGLGAKVYLLEVNLDRMRYLSDILPGNCFVLMSEPAAIRDLLKRADVVVGAVLVPGEKTPTMVTREMIGTMKKGSVLVDVSIDQGGCFETSRETTHSNPTFSVDGVVHYAVSNMPGSVPKTSTIALTNATLPYILEIAGKGWKSAVRENPEIRRGVNIALGKVTHPGVAEALDMALSSIDDLV